MTYQYALSKGTPRSSVLLHFLQACKHTPHWAVKLGKAHSPLAACQRVPCQVGRDGRTPAWKKGVVDGAAQLCGAAVGAMAALTAEAA